MKTLESDTKVFLNNRVSKRLKYKHEDAIRVLRRDHGVDVTSERFTEFVLDKLVPSKVDKTFADKVRRYLDRT